MLTLKEKNGLAYFEPVKGRSTRVLIALVLLLIGILFIVVPVPNTTLPHYSKPPVTSVDTTKILTTWVKSQNTKVPDHLAKSIVDSSNYWGSVYSIDPLLILSLISVESRFNVFAVSDSNALGLMQVILRWHKEKINGINPFDINDNIRIGTQILREYLDKHGTIPKALLQYNGSLGAKSTYAKDVLSTREGLDKFLLASINN